VKKGKGLVSWVLKRKRWTIQDVLEKEAKKGGSDVPKYVEMASGEWLSLE
jgi:hypothetical protein